MVRALAGDSTITSRVFPPPGLAAAPEVLAGTLFLPHIWWPYPAPRPATLPPTAHIPFFSVMSLTRRPGTDVPGPGTTGLGHRSPDRGRIAHNVPMAEFSYLVVYLPRETTRDAVRQILTDHAEYGRWELARLRLNPDGSRKATLRRPIIRAVRTVLPDRVALIPRDLGPGR